MSILHLIGYQYFQAEEKLASSKAGSITTPGSGETDEGKDDTGEAPDREI